MEEILEDTLEVIIMERYGTDGELGECGEGIGNVRATSDIDEHHFT